MLRWFPRLQVSTACFSCSPPDLNFLDPYFIFMYMHYNHCHRATADLQLNLLLLLLLSSSSLFNYEMLGETTSHWWIQKTSQGHCVLCLICVNTSVQGVSFIAAPSTATLPHRKPASAGTSRGSCVNRQKDERKRPVFMDAVLTKAQMH